jgi:hypothetical protein
MKNSVFTSQKTTLLHYKTNRLASGKITIVCRKSHETNQYDAWSTAAVAGSTDGWRLFLCYKAEVLGVMIKEPAVTIVL